MKGKELQLNDQQFKNAMEVFNSEWGGRGPSIPEIKVSYDDDTKRHFVIKRGEKVIDLGETIEVIILKSRNQYSLYAENKEDRVSTDEFDSFTQDVTLRKGGEPIKVAPYPEVKALIKEKYPELKFINVLYVMFKDPNDKEDSYTMHKIFIKPASRQNLWDYQGATGAKASFSFTTKLGTDIGKKGTTTYYPITFEKVLDMDPETFKSFMVCRMDLDNDIKAQEEAAAKKPTYDSTPDFLEGLVEE